MWFGRTGDWQCADFGARSRASVVKSGGMGAQWARGHAVAARPPQVFCGVLRAARRWSAERQKELWEAIGPIAAEELRTAEEDPSSPQKGRAVSLQRITRWSTRRGAFSLLSSLPPRRAGC